MGLTTLTHSHSNLYHCDTTATLSTASAPILSDHPQSLVVLNTVGYINRDLESVCNENLSPFAK